MEPIHPAGELARKIGFFAILGFAVVMLSGPAVALASLFLSLGLLLLPFVALGLMIWIPFQYLARGRNAAVGEVQGLGHAVGGTGRQAGQFLARALAFPIRLIRSVAVLAFRVIAGIFKAGFFTLRVATELTLVTLTGAAAGFALWAFGPTAHHVDSPLAMNVVLGGLIGAAAGVVMMIREHRGLVAVR
jgi:hypothetical protein